MKIAFRKHFQLYCYDGIESLQQLCDPHHIDVVYDLKYGKQDDLSKLKTPPIMHCVLTASEPHGYIYAGVSPSVVFGTQYPYVPHIVALPDIKSDYISELGIPQNAIVFGRHGGSDTFNIEWSRSDTERSCTK